MIAAPRSKLPEAIFWLLSIFSRVKIQGRFRQIFHRETSVFKIERNNRRFAVKEWAPFRLCRTFNFFYRLFLVYLEGIPQCIRRFLPQGRNPLTLPCRDNRLRWETVAKHMTNVYESSMRYFSLKHDFLSNATIPRDVISSNPFPTFNDKPVHKNTTPNLSFLGIPALRQVFIYLFVV